MNIGSKNTYPAGALSNFTPHPFTIDGVECASMEGFLQALKHKDIPSQEHVCSLVGFKAKKKGSKKNWKERQTLHWQGKEYAREGDEYQKLLDKAYTELTKNTKFQKALLATGNATLTHSIGKRKMCDTVLTIREFCSRLESARSYLQHKAKTNED